MARKLRLVASGDYLHTMGRDAPRDLGFDAFDDGPFDLRLLSASPQTARVEPADLTGADGLVMLGQYLPEASIAPVAESLAFVARAGVGVDKIDRAALARHGVVLFNVPDALTEGTAAGALALMLAASRRMIAMDGLTRDGSWDARQFHRGREIYGKTLGVIGPGRIGAELIRLVAPFRMTVLAHSPRLTPERAAGVGAVAATLDELLTRSHFVTICAPLTDETRGMIGKGEIARMRADAVLVNVGRGPIVDQAALAEALAAGRIFGAGLDVFENQPFERSDPLAALATAVLSPHAICDTYELRRAVLAEIVRQIRVLLTGAKPATLVDPDTWDDAKFRAKQARLLREIGG